MASGVVALDEEKVIIVGDEEDNAKNEWIALCLLGHLDINASFNARAMKSIIHNIWKPAKGLVV